MYNPKTCVLRPDSGGRPQSEFGRIQAAVPNLSSDRFERPSPIWVRPDSDGWHSSGGHRGGSGQGKRGRPHKDRNVCLCLFTLVISDVMSALCVFCVFWVLINFQFHDSVPNMSCWMKIHQSLIINEFSFNLEPLSFEALWARGPAHLVRDHLCPGPFRCLLGVFCMKSKSKHNLWETTERNIISRKRQRGMNPSRRIFRTPSSDPFWTFPLIDQIWLKTGRPNKSRMICEVLGEMRPMEAKSTPKKNPKSNQVAPSAMKK